MVMYNRDGSKRGVLETISDFVDSHIRVFRMLPWLMGCTGVLLMYRHSRGILRQFNSISDIPMSVVNGHVPLQGVVRRVSGESVWVWHIPVWRAWSKLPDSACGGIQCNLAGVTLLSNSEDWLQHCVYGRRVMFVPMSVQGNSLHSIIYTRVRWRRVCVNAELVAKRLALVGELENLPKTPEGLELTQKLLASQLKAKKRKLW